VAGADPSIPELPYVDSLLDTVKADLDTSRSLQQRLLTTQDTLLASALTVAGLFAGLAFSNHSRALAGVAVPFLLVLGIVDARTWVLFVRISERVRSLERLFHTYIQALRELKTARPQALAELRQQIDHYQFGSERTIEDVSTMEMLRSNWRRLRSWLYVLIMAALALSALLWVQPSSRAAPTCILTDGGGIARVNAPPTPAQGRITLVPCPSR
jgi:hypothetical protein